MSKKKDTEKKPLRYIGACKGEYWDEDGPHPIKPGPDVIVYFSPEMFKIRKLESVWEEPKDEKSDGKSKAEEVK